MERYPASIPLPSLRDGAYRQQSNIQVDEMGGGNIKTRRLGHGTPPTTKECVWRLRRADAAFFEGWLEHVLGKALAQFEMPLTTPMGTAPVTHICQLLADPRENRQPVSVMLWEYRAPVVVREFVTMDETETMAQYFAPFDLAELVARMASSTFDYVE